MNPQLREIASQKWYSQGLPGRPVFLTSAASIDLMHQALGFSYHSLFCSYKQDYATFNYPEKELYPLGERVLKKLKENPQYLHEKKNQYETELEKHFKYFETARLHSSELDSKELVELAKRFETGLEAANAAAHLIESISIFLEHKIRHRLMEKNTKTLNADFAVITSPTDQSFLSKKDEALWKIKQATAKKQVNLVQKFLENFYWVNSSYLGKNPILQKDVLQQARELEKFQKPDFKSLSKQKNELFEQYDFSGFEQQWIFWAAFAANWQDERKKNILKGIFALDTALIELAKRFKCELKFLHYLKPTEFSLSGLQNGSLEQTGRTRFAGCVQIKKTGQVLTFEGNDFVEFEKAMHQAHDEVEIIYGMSASLGTAMGPVHVCTTLDSIQQVKEGDVLVASMTRPEFVPAMKKSVAVITDDGGVTCHAAIVSRELGIPCVIGTRNATKVLKDGWLVQVKANHGQVIVLEKKT